MQNRDFKGVWIPKEIWLNTDLTIIDKCILTEIHSLDNEYHCMASNEYFAEFCQCSERKVTDSIKKLCELGYIEIISFDGRRRTISSNLSLVTNQSRKNCDSATKKMQTNNIVNNINTLSKDNELAQPEFNFGVVDEKPKKKTNEDEYLDCDLLIKNFTENKELRKLLLELAGNRMRMASSERHHFYSSTFKHYLDELSKVNDKIGAVKLSLQYNNTLKVMEPNKPYNSVPDTNTATQNRYSSDEERNSKMARNSDGTPMTF